MKAGVKSSVKQKIGDSVTVAAIIIAILFSIPLVTKGADAGKPAFAVVEVNGRESLRVALGEDGRDRTFDVEGSAGTSTIEVKNGRVRMLESDCPDKLCIGMGWAEKTGDSIVCIPNRVVIELVGPEKIKEVDTVTE